jgi:hypothetical protein
MNDKVVENKMNAERIDPILSWIFDNVVCSKLATHPWMKFRYSCSWTRPVIGCASRPQQHVSNVADHLMNLVKKKYKLAGHEICPQWSVRLSWWSSRKRYWVLVLRWPKVYPQEIHASQDPYENSITDQSRRIPKRRWQSNEKQKWMRRGSILSVQVNDRCQCLQS